MTDSKLKSILPAVIAGLVLTTAMAVGAAGQTTPAPSSSASSDDITPAGVIDMILHTNPGLDSYKAHAHLDIRQVNFPWLHPILDGSQFFSRPGFTTYDFPHTPAYLKGITKVEGAVGLASRWMRCYNMTASANNDAYNLTMHPKIRGEVREMDVVVDRHDGTIHHIDWYYWNAGDHVALDQYFGLVNGYKVVTIQKSTIQLHHIRAEGDGSFDNFEFNVAVPTPTPTPTDPLHACDN